MLDEHDQRPTVDVFIAAYNKDRHVLKPDAKLKRQPPGRRRKRFGIN
ncbi:hypothetical protein OZL92_06850 [Bacillus sonorensis]|uniref:Uncharacterized protein n=2 Tax=Bacillus sonorensis TaxID=119858 RepID=M5PCB6_9BACI|nr:MULTISPECIES: hypothetical protein [Bacillus]TWK83468.1 hypothetical protein CHCC20335_4539 [Bacillus paralicheniformis]ASB86799.1 hypothetical protein S101395_00244 [Bacillus sonorensis]EME73705.1 hypothetical protein BSONL12_18354 [Bacillus sonorensis L12]MCF7616053.1 hypothetical protein [Bacillus sonorensis]MCY7858019.1 hypothetical protein [Bacillus sonorensis]